MMAEERGGYANVRVLMEGAVGARIEKRDARVRVREEGVWGGGLGWHYTQAQYRWSRRLGRSMPTRLLLV